MQINGSGFYGGVAKQLADGVEVVAFIEQMGGEAVTQGVEAAGFGYADFFLASYRIIETEALLIWFPGFCPGNSQNFGE